MAPLPPPPAFEGPVDIGPAVPEGLVARFVRYPGCQQLQLWLPEPDHHGTRMLRVQREDGLVVEDAPLHQRLSGPVQLLFDTLAWPPGHYRLTVAGDDTHGPVQLALHKHDGDAPDHDGPAGDGQHRQPPAPAAPAVAAEADDTRAVYRDGWGRVMPDPAQALRDAAWLQLLRRFSRQVQVVNQGRGGTVIYTERLPRRRSIQFDHEMAGGAWHWMVNVPTAMRWQAATGFDPAERDEVLRFVAQWLQRTQGSSWAWTLTDDAIAFHDPPPQR